MRCSQLFKLAGLILLLGLFVGPNSAIQVQNDNKKISSFKEDKICIGTNGRMSVPSNREHHYQNLRDRYTNCTLVDGNLELTWLQDKNLDLSFLYSIREVTGYVLISHVDMKKIVLPNLQIIRGRQLFKLNVLDQQFALIVTLSKMENLELPSLRDILQGSAGFYNNYNLCHIRTINWEEIITGFNSTSFYFYNFTQPERECPPCHESCKEGCWGEGEHNCQKFNKIFCSPQCHGGRCFGPNPRECCHLFCAGGCTGPKQNDCLACRNFYDGGVCKQECPSMMRYNPLSYSWETNPAGKYAYGSTCVKDCPDHLLKDNGACVRSCPPNKKALEGECVPCDGPCPKNCFGVEIVNADNIDSFKECTVVEGSLSILDSTFNGYQDFNTQNSSFGGRHSNMHPDRLSVFKTLKEITGFFNVQGSHPDFTNLSYFSNLEVIGGRQTHDFYSSLYIVRTSLQSLGLRSLRKIRAGGVSILENKNLCLSSTIPWQQIVSKPQSNTISIKKNGEDSQCKENGLVCDRQCSDDGCWGPNPDECLNCKSYKLGDTCVSSCNSMDGVYDTGSPKLICAYCDEQCESGCIGSGPSNCTQCRNVRDGPFCVAQCPESKYNDNGHCKPCSDVCVGGCTGPSSKLGAGGCNSCEKALLSNETNTVEICLRSEEPCPDGFYNEYIPSPEDRVLKKITSKSFCRKCHQRCKTCTAYGIHTPQCECLRYSNGEQCEDYCPSDYFADERNHKCVRCSEHCRGCYGPSEAHCEKCKHLTVYYEDDLGVRRFNCTDECPKDRPYKNYNNADNLQVPYCSDKEPSILVNPSAQDAAQRLGKNVFAVATLIGVIALFILGISIRIYKTARSKEDKLNNAWHMAGFIEDTEPLNDANVKPNLGKIRMINEQELRKTETPLGFGEFGTVYKGLWVPTGQNVKVPVAIKVLREDTNENFLEEAYIMASVDHPNLVKLLGVCMTSPPMLITPLMPIGCLLTYVKSNKYKIGPEPMLQWCLQIAKGMAYLEEMSIVHRDLALRNVLIQWFNCVKITDFGLAKLLPRNECEYKSEGGKMPIKWLAPECILEKKFTHKSDVWAFSITIWEIFTFGEKPFDGKDAKDMYHLLKNGERPYQPEVCSAEIWKVMGYCWLPDYNQRPTFKELVTTFEKFKQNPRLYLSTAEHGLPSYTQHDNKDWLNSLKEEGPEQLMEAEDYLQLGSKRAPSDNGSLILNNNAIFRQMTLNSCGRLPSCGSNTSSLPPSTPTIKTDGQNNFELGGMNPMAATTSFVNHGHFLTLGNKQNAAYNRFNDFQNGIATTTGLGKVFNFNTNSPFQTTATFYNARTASLNESLDNVKLIPTPTTITSNMFHSGSKNNSSSSADFRKYSQNSADSAIGHYNNCNNLNHVREGSMNSTRYTIDQARGYNQESDTLDNVFLPNSVSYPLSRNGLQNQVDSADYLTPLAPGQMINHQSTVNHHYFGNNGNMNQYNMRTFDAPMNSSQAELKENLEYYFGENMMNSNEEMYKGKLV